MDSTLSENRSEAQRADFYAELEQLYLLPNWTRETEGRPDRGPHTAAARGSGSGLKSGQKS